MKYNRYIQDGPLVSEIGLGAWQLGNDSGWQGMSEKDAVGMVEKAIRLNPMPPSAWYVFLGSALFNAERYDEAVAAGQKALQLSSNNIFAHLLLVLSYSMTGRDQEARNAAAEVLRIQPNFSVDSFARRLPYRDPVVVERQVSIYHKAGLK